MNNTIQPSSDNIYYNIQITNNDTSGRYYQAQYQEEKNVLIVDKPDTYFLTVNRFSIPANLIPIFFFETDGTGINNGIYTITLRFQTFHVQQKLIYVPYDTSLPVPTTFNPQEKSNYYFVYSYRQVLEYFNTALASALSALKILVGPPIASAEAPYFIYDSETELISLITQSSHFNSDLATPIKIFLNTPSLQLFEEFTGFFRSSSSTTGENWEFQIKFDGDNGFAPSGTSITNPPTYLKSTAEYVNYRTWSPIRSVVFITNAIPISSEVQPNLVQFGDVQSGGTNYRQILTDFEPIIQRAGTERTQLQYYPQGPYRLVDIKTSQPLTKFDISLYWADRVNYLYPIYITFGEVLSIKLLFIKKSLYNNELTNYSAPNTLQFKSSFSENVGGRKTYYLDASKF